jgi:hypothetical protein
MATTSVDLRIVLFSLDDSEGQTLSIYEDTKVVPREFEIVLHENERYQVMENGVVWATHVKDRIRVSVYVTPMPEPVEEIVESKSESDKATSRK